MEQRREGSSKLHGEPLDENGGANLRVEGECRGCGLGRVLNPDTMKCAMCDKRTEQIDPNGPMERLKEGVALGEQGAAPVTEVTVDPMNPAEALLAFIGMLTSRRQILALSAGHDAAPAMELLKKFCEVNKLEEPREGWDKRIVLPPQGTYEMAANPIRATIGIVVFQDGNLTVDGPMHDQLVFRGMLSLAEDVGREYLNSARQAQASGVAQPKKWTKAWWSEQFRLKREKREAEEKVKREEEARQLAAQLAAESSHGRVLVK